ncbi:MAG: NUDIX hydrolase [Qipengyuania sp.]
MQADPAQQSPIPAATLVVFRHAPDGGAPELLMVVRSRTMTFAGGMAVFPGGRVDQSDRALAAQIGHDLADDDEAAHRIAALRETLEETGLAIGVRGRMDAARAAEIRLMLIEREDLAPVLDRFGLALDLAALTPFARWLPLGMSHPRIFDTRFYLANLGTGAVDIAVDATENTRLFWISAQGALQMAESGDIQVIFPTRRNLERLAQFANFQAARAHAEATPVRPITPEIDTTASPHLLRIPEGLGYPVTSEPLDSLRRGEA